MNNEGFTTAWATHGPLELVHQHAVIEHCQRRHIPVVSLTSDSGFPGLFIPKAKGGLHGLLIELKTDRKSCVGTNQRKWQMVLVEEGYMSLICYGKDEAILQIERYLSINSPTY